MNNEIPYIDTSSGTPVPTYYIENPDEGKPGKHEENKA
jgi:hypothetical protein